MNEEYFSCRYDMCVDYSQQIRKVLNEVDKYLKGWGLDVRNKTKHYFL